MKPNARELWSLPFVTTHLHQARDYVINLSVNTFFAKAYTGMAYVESPLEAAFLAWWTAIQMEFETLQLIAQQEVDLDGARFRLDFSIEAHPKGPFTCLPNPPKIAVEVDGHEFHERTAEQVTYRNRRDRALTLSGWTVLHFSGSEFHRDPLKVVRDEVFFKCHDMFAVALKAFREQSTAGRTE